MRRKGFSPGASTRWGDLFIPPPRSVGRVGRAQRDRGGGASSRSSLSIDPTRRVVRVAHDTPPSPQGGGIRIFASCEIIRGSQNPFASPFATPDKAPCLQSPPTP